MVFEEAQGRAPQSRALVSTARKEFSHADRADRPAVAWTSAMARRAHTLDTVKLLRDWDGWPAGTVGAVVSEHPETALVEIVTESTPDADGLPERALLDDLITV